MDDETQEVLYEQTAQTAWVQKDEKMIVIKPGHKKNTGNNPEFIKLYRSNIIDVITRDYVTSETEPEGPKKTRKKWLSIPERGVFLSMLVFVDWESNYIVHPKTKHLLNDTTLSELIGYDRAHLTEITKELSNKGLIAIIKNGNGRGNSYMINSNLVFNGRKMKDINEHKVFETCGYRPAVAINHKENDKRK